ncbi:MAG: teicoplanin resistance protein VanZ [Desulfuromonas sp.]|nr:MAG: teicoplanin resistance protein VanZ [Desulfuromonas sp.]
MISRLNAKFKLSVLLPWVLFAAWAVIVLWASLDARPFRPLVRLMAWDKLQHASAYALLTFFCGLALRTLMRRPFWCWWAACLFSVGYGAVVELLQHTMTRNRRGDPLDLLADLLGSLVVVAVIIPFEIRSRR